MITTLGRGQLIAGAWQGGDQELTSINPATGKRMWGTTTASAPQIESAIRGAAEAQPDWGRRTFAERLPFLKEFKSVLEKRKKELSQLIGQETGKPFWEASTEVAAMIGKVDISIDAYKERTGTTEREQGAARAWIRHRPHGVVAVLGPYNFPGHIPNGHLVPALLAGNCCIFKPSELTPAVGEMLVACFVEAGLPDGTVSLLQGGGDVGRALTNHPGINGVFFTGSSRTGLKLSEQFGSHPEKILALEMGGNNPLVIAQIEEVEAAVPHIIQSAFLTSGQRCTCARRLIIVEGPTTARLISKLIDTTKQLRIGPNTMEPEPFMGPVISEHAAELVTKAFNGLVSRGGRALMTPERTTPGTGLVTPAIVDMTDATERPDEEVFGPLLQIIRVPNLKTAISEANNTRFGLSAGIFTDDDTEYQQFLLNIRAGIVNRNMQLTGASSAAPFGGIGHSGNHRPSAYYAADYCAYPVASMEMQRLTPLETLPPGMEI